ncbi:MAG: hypothetical protein JNJ45_03525 [Chthonomonas sp.]|nr:hypothetical protein [Chthonomonas sp.]
MEGRSGTWLGWSVQWGNRITETLHLNINGGRIVGVGSDRDGDFEVIGTFGTDGNVSLTRRYTYTTEPSQGGVGIPYLYQGKWDGAVVSGNWCTAVNPMRDGGAFEMWPGEDEEEYRLADLNELELTVPGRR